MAGILELKFDAEHGKTMTISIQAPKQNVTSSEVSSVMQTIIEKDIFHVDGYSLIGKNQARIVERNITTFDV